MANGQEVKKEKKKRTRLQKIVNIFLYIGLGIFLLLVIAFAASQTSFFRNWLREKAMEIADDNLNGKVYIGELDGTIFTSLILRNTNVTMGTDTLLNAGRIELRTSPLQLLFKKIYVRKVELDDTKINLVRDNTGEFNISKLIPPPEAPDTTPSKFLFKIIVADLKLRNIDFSLRDYNVKVPESYDNMNLHNLIVNDLNLSLNAYADISNHDYEAVIHSLSFVPNIRGFALNDLSGDFIVKNESLGIRDLIIKTDSSGFRLNAAVNNFSIFDSTKNNDFFKAGLSLDLAAEKLSFSDISPFVPSLKILNGSIAANIQTSGSFKLLDLESVEIGFGNTHLQTKGRIENIDAGREMQIFTEFTDTHINQQDINNLLPSLKVPVYNEYGMLQIDSLVYKGKPLNFFTKLDVNTDKGSFGVNGNLNFEKTPIEYDLNFATNNLDISPLAGISTNLTSKGSVTGIGTNPDSLNASIRFAADGSVVSGNKLDTLQLIADAKSKNIKYKLTALSDTAYAFLNGSIDFAESKHPSYELEGEFKNLNLATILKDTTAETDLNFSITASGKDFNPDSMDLFLNTTLHNSSIHGINIDTTRAIVDIRKDEGGGRVVNIISDLADITITGNFKVMDAVNLISAEAKIVAKAVKDKINLLMPSIPEADSLRVSTESFPVLSKIPDKTHLDYVIEFKDFQLLSLLMGGKQLELDGDLQGSLDQNTDSLNIVLKTNLDYLKYQGVKDLFLISKLNLNLGLNNNLDSISLAGLNTDIKMNIERIFAGSDIKDLTLGLKMKGDSAAVDFSANLENYLYADVDSKLHFNSGVDILFDTLSVKYNNFDLSNRNPISVLYTPDKIEFKEFKLYHKKGSINLNGTLLRHGSQDLTVSVKGITGSDLSSDFLGLSPENSIKSYLNFDAEIKGDFDSPLMTVRLNADRVTYKNKKFGSLVAGLDYKNEQLNTDIRFIDSLRNYQNPKLKITGEIPVNLAFSGVKDRINKDAPVDISVNADSFKLGALGDILPEVNKINGELSANLHIGGTYNNLQPEGSLVLNNASFIVEKNNLEYQTGLKLSVTPERIKVDSLLIKNTPGTQDGGQMTGSGEALLHNLKVVSSDFKLNGQLKVLSEASKTVSPSVYGDLVVATQGDMSFTLDTTGLFLSVPIDVKEAKLTFPQTESSYQNTLNNFIYVYPNDTLGSQTSQTDFQTLVELAHQHKKEQQANSTASSSFNYKVDVHVEKEAQITFVLSKELNQNLVAILRGDFHYERLNGKTEASGELNLLSGSTLEFIKTFEADGTIKFENQLNNPYLDITATYTDYYYPASDSTSKNEVEVAVKIKIKGFLKELGKNLVQNQDNIAVYYGAKNIEDNTPDPTKSAADAVFFILTGNFTEGASQQDRYAAASTAASLAGSVLGGFLNKQFGDIIKRVELRQVGTTTKFNLIGRAGDIRYSVGGTTNVFQDISQANVKLEYPITNNLLIRLERKQSVTDINTNNINEMINELGLKYKFEF